MMAEGRQMTRSEFTKREAELEYLKSVRRPEVQERIKEARSYGDISENAEYDAAQDEKAELDEKISRLEELLNDAIVIEDEDIDTEFVGVGLTVRVKDLEFDEEEEYAIVGSSEIDPEKNYISSESPIGKQLVGKRVGDVAQIDIPDGITIKYEILGIFKRELS
jgi:transcription elongation factor GreA